MWKFFSFKNKIIIPEKVKGKSEDDIIKLYGIPDIKDTKTIIYIVDRTIFNRKGKAVILDFNSEGFCINVVKVRNE